MEKQRRSGWGVSLEAEDGGLSKGDLEVEWSGECPFLDRKDSESSEAVEQSGAARGQGGRVCVCESLSWPGPWWFIWLRRNLFLPEEGEGQGKAIYTFSTRECEYPTYHTLPVIISMILQGVLHMLYCTNVLLQCNIVCSA